MSANKHRGEIAVTLEGAAYVLRPDFEAVAAIDEQLGGILNIAKRSFEGQTLTLHEIAVIVCEGLRAHGRAGGLASLKAVKLEAVKRQVFASGVTTLLEPAMEFLRAALTGGVEANPPKAEAEAA